MIPATYRFLTFEEVGPSASGKTSIYRVANRIGVHLGLVSWYGAFRKYAFFPADDMVFDAGCLRDIADFTEARTKEHGQ